MRIERSYVCDECGDAFADPDECHSHELSHITDNALAKLRADLAGIFKAKRRTISQVGQGDSE